MARLTSFPTPGFSGLTYAFRWDEEGRPIERAALLLHVAGDTYRVIYDPRSVLNERVIPTLIVAE